MGEHLSDLMCWWRWELGRLPGMRRRREAAPDLVLRVKRGGILVEPGEAGQPGFEAILVQEPGQAAELAARLLPRNRGARPEIWVLIEPERRLKRRLSAVRLPRSRVAAMARLDLQSSTPFSLDELFLLIPQYREADAESAYYAVKKSILVPLLEALRDAGVAATAVALAEPDGVVHPDRPSIAEVIAPPLRTILARRALTGGAALAVAGFVAAVGLAHWRYSAAEAELDQAIAAVESEVAVLRSVIAARDSKVAQIGAVREEKRGAVPLASIMEELSRALPDSTWLTDVEVSGTRVRFTGISGSAAALIPVLEASPLFRAPTFMEPVVRAPNFNGERFTIAMDVEAAGG